MTDQKLVKIPIKDLAKKTICEGHLYLMTKEGRKFYLMKPGIMMDQDFIKKHALNNTVFDFISVVNPSIVEKFSTLLREWKYVQFEKDLKTNANHFIQLFAETYMGDEHLLSFALACHQELNCLSPETLLKMHQTDINLFKKALYSSALAVVIALANDFYHYQMVRDFYNLTFALDFGLCETNYSYYVAQACNQENKYPGTGTKWMEDTKASPSEIAVFLGHPKKGYDFFKTSGFLAHQELAEIVLYQHELANGSGFPRGVPKGQISSWEAVVILADTMVEIEDSHAFEVDVWKFLVTFTGNKLGELPIERVFRKLRQHLEHQQSLKETGA